MVKELGLLFVPSKESSASVVLWSGPNSFFYEGDDVSEGMDS